MKNLFSKKEIKADYPNEPKWQGQRDSTYFGMRPWNETAYESWKNTEASEEVDPYSQAEERGKKEISKFDPEYEWLMKLINIVVKAGVPPEQIKALTIQHPFVTVDDAGDLASKIWTLATEKYNIPREWLIKKLPEKKANTSVSGPRPDDVAKEADEESPCAKCGHKKIAHWWSGQPEAWCKECDNEGRKLCKQYIPKQTKQASPETDHALAMSIGEDVIREYFFEKGIRWSQVVQFIKDQAPSLTDEDIVNLKTDTKYKLEQYKIQIDSKKHIRSSNLLEIGKITTFEGKKLSVTVSEDLLDKYINTKRLFHEGSNWIANAAKSKTELLKTLDYYDIQMKKAHDAVLRDSLSRMPSLNDADKDDVRFLISDFAEEMMEKTSNLKVRAKKKGLSLDKVLQILEQKGPKPTHVDYKDHVIEFTDGSKMSFDSATQKALELNKNSSEESEEQERNKDSGTGFYDSPGNFDQGKRPQSDESIWPADTWLPRGTEEEEAQDPTNVMSFQKPFSRKAFLKISKPESGYVDNKTGYTCGRCAYFNKEENKCGLVQGEIKAQGCCNYWDDKAQLKQEGPGYTKEEAGYIEYPNVNYRCDECVFFDSKAKTCTKVEGNISPTASCNLWQPISKQAFSKKELI